jgi:uncharacterized RDD family membrane protein YckC
MDPRALRSFAAGAGHLVLALSAFFPTFASGRCVAGFPLVLLAVLTVAAQASADPPGSLRSGAAGDGHVWWAVERIAPPVPGRSRGADGPRYLLMHHASVEPAPTERLVMALTAEPEAIAAEGSSVVVVLRAEGDRKRLVLLTRAQRNQAVGHWYSEPRPGPKVLSPLDSRGRIIDAELAGGTVFIARALREEDGTERLAIASLAADAGAEWTDTPLPPLDGVGQPAGARWRLFRDADTLCAIGFDGGAPAIARLAKGSWQVERLPGIDGASVVGAFALEGRIVLVGRSVPDGREDARISLSVLRQGRATAWAGFDEPARPWMVAPFGSDAVLVELDSEGRGTVRTIRPSANAPLEPVTLAPPGFASGNWIHLPIIGVASLALMVATLVVVGSMDAKPVAGRPLRPGGAALSRRMLAFAVDAAPAFAITWAIVGGSPQRLFEHPALSANIESAFPCVAVLAGGWLLGAIGDVAFGRSIGKRLLGIAVIGRDGGPASWRARLFRSVLALVTVFSPMMMLLAYFQPAGDGPAEVVSGTAVVDAGAVGTASRGGDAGDRA